MGNCSVGRIRQRLAHILNIVPGVLPTNFKHEKHRNGDDAVDSVNVRLHDAGIPIGVNWRGGTCHGLVFGRRFQQKLGGTRRERGVADGPAIPDAAMGLLRG